ncbi:uncharacterized protein DS421_10g301310 [Arachis hypogaea]|nr:uncharacterized protein DS421_10g301310 [Arachis hypogaea]
MTFQQVLCFLFSFIIINTQAGQNPRPCQQSHKLNTFPQKNLCNYHHKLSFSLFISSYIFLHNISLFLYSIMLHKPYDFHFCNLLTQTNFKTTF